ncbi:MAG TPA: hypothetical protein VK789_06915 [Bryobacteraceae bacterium]|nr:hypothetical protein [Bryobacteraceae bacterium]
MSAGRSSSIITHVRLISTLSYSCGEYFQLLAGVTMECQAKLIRGIAELAGGFAYALQTALHRVTCHRILAKGLRIHSFS